MTTVDEPVVVDAVPAGASRILELGDDVALHITDRGGRIAEVRFAHNCRMISETRRVRCAPLLHPNHVVEDREDGILVSPSILCPDCGTHGFVEASVWSSCHD